MPVPVVQARRYGALAVARRWAERRGVPLIMLGTESGEQALFRAIDDDELEPGAADALRHAFATDEDIEVVLSRFAPEHLPFVLVPDRDVELKQRIEYLERRGQDAARFLGVYWGRIASSISVVLMTMLALPFVLGSLRSASASARMIVGLVIGLGYYVLGELSANSREVFALDPVVAAWAPSAVLFAITALAVARLR